MSVRTAATLFSIVFLAALAADLTGWFIKWTIILLLDLFLPGSGVAAG